MRAFALAVLLVASDVSAQTAAAPPQASATPQTPVKPPSAAPGAAPLPAPAGAQPAAPGAQPPAAGPQPSAPAAPPAAEVYTYDPASRRDPFVSLIGTGIEAPAAKRGEGAAGITVAELSVRGVMQSKGALVAMVQGPDNKTYIVHSGDRLADGTIKSIVPQGLVIIQEVNDPLSLVKQREVRKLLRSLEDAKQ